MAIEIPALNRTNLLMLAGVLLLVVPGVLLLLPGDDPEDSPKNKAGEKQEANPVKESSDAEKERIADLVQLMEAGKYTKARAYVSSSITAPFHPSGYSRFLEIVSTKMGMPGQATQAGLVLYGELLNESMRNGADVENFAYYLKHLRNLALTYGGKSFLSQVMGRVIGDPQLSKLYPQTRPDILEYNIMFEHWEEALLTFTQILAEGGKMTKQKRLKLLLMGRHLARVYGSSPNSESTSVFDKFLNELEQSLEIDKEVARSIRPWLRGLAAYHNFERVVNRGSRLIELALPPRSTQLAYGFTRLDFARALREEANRRESNLHPDFIPAGKNRARQLFLVGRGAAQIADQDELELAIMRLREDAGIEVRAAEAYQDLLESARDLLAGKIDRLQIQDRIRTTLKDQAPLLRKQDILFWNKVATDGFLPGGNEGQILFRNGKIWADLRQWGRLERTIGKLKKSISSREDSVSLGFLQALNKYRKNELDGVYNDLLDILDQGDLPPGLTRPEISELIVGAEDREAELNLIAQKRNRAHEVLAEIEKYLDPDGLDALLARMVGWQLRLDQEGLKFLMSADGDESLRAIKKDLNAQNLEFSVIEQGLGIETQLLALASQLQKEKRYDEALQSIDKCQSLVRNSESYAEERGEIYALKAQALPLDQETLKHEYWQKAGDYYFARAESSFGDPEFYYEATEAFMKAGNYTRALEAVGLYEGRSASRGANETRRWRKKLYLTQIQRKLKNYDEAITNSTGTMASFPIGRLRYDFLLERAMCYEAKRDHEKASADYAEIYNGLRPPNKIWLKARFESAQMLDSKASRMEVANKATAAEIAAAKEAARKAWMDLALQFPGEANSSTFAIALYRAGEACILQDKWEKGRDFLLRLQESAIRVIGPQSEPVSPSEMLHWSNFVEKGAFALADSYFTEKNFERARLEYNSCLRKFRGRPYCVLAYIRLAEIEQELSGRAARATADRHLQKARALLGQLKDGDLAGFPPHKNREFWLEQIDELQRGLNI